MESILRWVELWDKWFVGFWIEAVEKEFEIDLGTSLGYVGRLDAMAKSPRHETWVIEWKTGQPKQLDETQVQTYALAVQQMEPRVQTVVAAVADILNVQIRRRTMGPGALKAARTMLRRRALFIERVLHEEESPIARPGLLCGGCPLLDMCEPGREWVRSSPSEVS